MKKGIFWAFVAALVCFLVGGWFGLEMGRKRAENKPPKIEVRIDTVTVTEVRTDTIEKVRTITANLPAVPDADEPVDTIDPYWQPPADTVAVQIPISRYVAQKDSLYRVVAEGYAVDFKEITVYPKTVTVTNTIEVAKPTRWGIGVQAGYGATLHNNTVKLAPYIGVGISYNIITW